MAIKQTRRSVSLGRAIYEAAKRAAAEAKTPLSKFIEETVKARLTSGAFDKRKAFEADVAQLKAKWGIDV